MLPRQNKRGMDVVFVWIFVILAGAVILAFFVSFSLRHAESSTTVTNIRYLDTVSSIITTFATSLEAVNVNNLNLEKIDDDAKLRSYYKSKFVFFTAPKKLDGISGMETPSSVVEIKLGDYGDVIFYENGMQKASQHIGKEIIYGAIFVDDYDNYACLLEKTMDKVAQITSLYSEKTKLLAIKSTNQCLYQEIKTTLDKQARFAQVLNIPEVYKISQLLVEENRLLDNQDCSLIF